MPKTIVIIAAIANNLAVGHKGQLSFHISDDLRRFKKLTMGYPVIMGRKTFESLPGGALPGRQNIVVTKQNRWEAPGVTAARSLTAAIDAAAGADKVFIIGGGEIYRQALDVATTLEITRIFADDPLADTFFPQYDNDWDIIDSSEIFTDQKSGLKFQFQTLRKFVF